MFDMHQLLNENKENKVEIKRKWKKERKKKEYINTYLILIYKYKER